MPLITDVTRSAAVAVQLLTRIPVRLATVTDADLRRSCVFFPAVGLIVAAAGVLTRWALAEPVGPAAATVLAVTVMVMITGAFHEDGLADVSDAIAGGSTPAARVRILDDPRHGTYGVAALAASIVLRVTALGALGNATGAVAATLAHGLGRGGAVAVMGLAPARATGLAAAAHTDTTGRARTAGVAVTIAVAALLSGWWVAVAVAASICSTALVTAMCRRAFGGINGDVLGAVEQVGEVTTLIVVVTLTARHSLPSVLL